MSLEKETIEILTRNKKGLSICREYEINPNNIAKFICAIANSGEGYIIIGASYEGDNYIIKGVSGFYFKNILDKAIKELSVAPDLENDLIRINNKDLFVIKVSKSQHSILFKNNIYVLENSEVIKLKGEVKLDKTKVFIVHGHDEQVLESTARFIEKLGIEAIVLKEQASKGQTIIEKIEENSNVGFGIVLYTPCDDGKAVGEENYKKRARQNVVFEHGFLIGKLGRDKVCALVKGDLEQPNDISGVVYVKIDSSGGWKMQLVKEMKIAGYDIDLNKAF